MHIHMGMGWEDIDGWLPVWGLGWDIGALWGIGMHGMKLKDCMALELPELFQSD
jgi:hypothetical protein